MEKRRDAIGGDEERKMERAERPKEEDGWGQIRPHSWSYSQHRKQQMVAKFFLQNSKYFQIIKLGKFVHVSINISMECFSFTK